MRACEGVEVRWAVSDGPVELPGGGAPVSCGGAAVEAAVSNGMARLSAEQLVALMPALGRYELDWAGSPVHVERVGSRVCTRADLAAYGAPTGDGFEDASRFPDAAVEAAIQAAEEAFEHGTGRSFCRRAVEVALKGDGSLEELPVVDAVSASAGELVGDRQIRAGAPATATVVYGARCDRSVKRAVVQLAASYLRPRVGAENARGYSADGVYVSYTLETGEEGSWTGLPAVDTATKSHHSRSAALS